MEQEYHLAIDWDILGPNFCEAIKAYLNENIEDLSTLMLASAPAQDPRAEVREDTLQVTHVEHIGGTEYRAYFTYDWGAHYGCRDMDKSDSEEGSFRLFLGNDQFLLKFNIPEARTTLEEF